jgi:serine/threonine-protein kinase
VGIRGPETAGALGLAHVTILREALDELERLSSQSTKDARRLELDRLHVQPALYFLRLSGSSHSVEQEGLIAYLEKRYDQALAKAQQALAQDPWMVEAHLLVAEVELARAHGLMDQGGYEAAAQACSRGLAAAQRAENLARSMVDAYALEGEALSMELELAIRQGRPFAEPGQAAKDSLEQALRADPEAAEVHVKLARLYRAWADADGEQGRDPEGLLAASVNEGLAALRCQPDHPEASLLLSMTYRGQADNRSSHGLDPLPVLDRALAIGRQAIALRPRDAIAVNSQGNAFLSRAEFLQEGGQDATADLEAALGSFAEASACNASYASPWINSGICYRRLATQRAAQGGDPLPLMAKAEASYRSALRINPKNLTTQHNLGVLCCYKAEMELKRGLDPKASLADSTNAFRQALDINPGFARSHGGLGRVAAVRGLKEWSQGGNPLTTFQEAIAHYRQALRCNATDAEHAQRIGQVWLYTAQFQRDQGKDRRQALEAARRAFAQALTLNPRNADCLLGLARVQLAREAWAEAERAADQAHALSAHAPEPLLVQAEIALAKADTQTGAAREANLRKAGTALDAVSAREARNASVALFRAQLLLLGSGASDRPARAQEAENLLHKAFSQDHSLELLYRDWLARATRAGHAPSGREG